MTQFKSLILTFALVLSQIICLGQDSIRNHFLYNLHSFSVQYTAGFNNSKVSPTFGDPNRFVTSVGVVHQLNLGYTFNLTSKLGLTFGAGIGMFPFRYSLVPTGAFIGFSDYPQKYNQYFNPFSRLHLLVDYHLWISKKIAFKAGLGGGFYKFTESFSHAGSSDYSPQQFLVTTHYPGKFTPNLTASLGLGYTLKNDNILGLSFSYDYLFGQVIIGNYELENSAQRGAISNNGNQFNINLSYTFTQAQKRLAVEKGYDSGEFTIDSGKLNFRKEKRYIDPKSILFNVSLGSFSARNIVSKDFPYMKSTSLLGPIFSANVEIGHKENRFFQIGSNWAQYYTANRFYIYPESYYMGASGGTIYKALQVSAGYGIRLINKRNNINYLNVSAGASVNYYRPNIGTGMSNQTMLNGEGEVIYSMDITEGSKRNIYPTLYLNLSRDFQLTKSFYLTADYRYNFGFITTYQEEVIIHKQPDLSESFIGYSRINGTSFSVQIGLKYKFVPKGSNR